MNERPEGTEDRAWHTVAAQQMLLGPRFLGLQVLRGCVTGGPKLGGLKQQECSLSPSGHYKCRTKGSAGVLVPTEILGFIVWSPRHSRPCLLFPRPPSLCVAASLPTFPLTRDTVVGCRAHRRPVCRLHLTASGFTRVTVAILVPTRAFSTPPCPPPGGVRALSFSRAVQQLTVLDERWYLGSPRCELGTMPHLMTLRCQDGTLPWTAGRKL